MADISKITALDNTTYNIKDTVARGYNTTIAPVEASTTAVVEHPLGSIFYINNVLYRALDDISVGDTIVIGAGGNATQTTVAQNFKRVVTLTSQEYSQLSDAEKDADIVYIITDDNSVAANNVSYNNTSSGLTATNVQAAIDEVYGDIPTQAADIGALPSYGMGENLLRNWYFVGGGTGRGVFPVNQRGFTTSSGVNNIYSVDGWFVNNGAYGTQTLNADGFYINSSSGLSTWQQYFGVGAEYTGLVMVVSVLTNYGFVSGTVTVPARTGSTYSKDFAISTGVDIRFQVLSTSEPGYSVQFRVASGYSVTIKAVKLELGTEQTLAHQESGVWVLNEIPDYEEELLKCQTSVNTFTNTRLDTYANKSIATEQQLAYVESGTTASRAYAVGEYFCWNGLLYRVTAAISSGGTFTPGTNCETTTVMSAITANWTPVNATTPYANRNYFFKFGKFMLIAVCIQLSSDLNAGQEREILSSVLSTCGAQVNPNQLTTNTGIAFLSSSNDIPIRIIYTGGKLYVRNQSGTTVDTSRIIYGQIVLGIQ